jgi:hypothetical protein
MLKRGQSRESRTMSELIREALRHYERRSWWDDVNAYGRSKSTARASANQTSTASSTNCAPPNAPLRNDPQPPGRFPQKLYFILVTYDLY